MGCSDGYLKPRLFVAIVSGASGTFSSLADRARLKCKTDVAKGLGLAPTRVPSRSIVDHFAEFVCVLGLLGRRAAKLAAKFISLLRRNMEKWKNPYRQAQSGSSTMP